MRKTSIEIAKALKNKKKESFGYASCDGTRVIYRGYEIASFDGRYLTLTMAGWDTPTTRRYLNAILEVFKLDGKFYQKNFTQYFKFNSVTININDSYAGLYSEFVIDIEDKALIK